MAAYLYIFSRFDDGSFYIALCNCSPSECCINFSNTNCGFTSTTYEGTIITLTLLRSVIFTERILVKSYEDHFRKPPLRENIHSALEAYFSFETLFIIVATNYLKLLSWLPLSIKFSTMALIHSLQWSELSPQFHV